MQARNGYDDRDPVFSRQPAIFGSIPYWDQDRSFAVFRQHVNSFDVVSLFWYRLNEDGSISTYEYAREDEEIIRFAHANNVKVLALVANLPERGDWDPERVDRVIRDPQARAAHINELVALAESRDFDGINIDYEFLQDSQTQHYAVFINELGAALRDRGKILAVAIHPQRKGSATRGQDISKLNGADILAFMTYDQHWETSPPGPMAAIPWMREVIEYAFARGVPPERLYLGIPLDGYDWVNEGRNGWQADGLVYQETEAIIESNDIEPQFDPVAISPHFNYVNNGRNHEVWYEDVRSFQAKMDLAREYGLGGVALWRLGGEDMRIYDVILAQ